MIPASLRRITPLVLLVAATACGAYGSGPVTNGHTVTGGNGAGGAAVDTITVGDNFFSPATVTISTGQTVVWVWTGSGQHSVTFNDSTIAGSGTQTTGTFSHTFSATGTFAYFDSVVGAAVMSGSVTVQ